MMLGEFIGAITGYKLKGRNLTLPCAFLYCLTYATESVTIVLLNGAPGTSHTGSRLVSSEHITTSPFKSRSHISQATMVIDSPVTSIL